MRLETCLQFEGRTLQGALPKLAYICSALVAGFYAAVDSCLIALDKTQHTLGARHTVRFPAYTTRWQGTAL